MPVPVPKIALVQCQLVPAVARTASYWGASMLQRILLSTKLMQIGFEVEQAMVGDRTGFSQRKQLME